MGGFSLTPGGIFDKANIELAHEAYVFDNGMVWGFSAKGVRMEFTNPSEFTFHGPQYDDDKMMRVIYDTEWEGNSYSIWGLQLSSFDVMAGIPVNPGFNCQDWCDALRQNYFNLYLDTGH